MSLAYQLAYALEKQAISAKLVTRALTAARGRPERWRQLAEKTVKWLDGGAIGRAHTAMRDITTGTQPISPSAELLAAAEKMVGHPVTIATRIQDIANFLRKQKPSLSQARALRVARAAFPETQGAAFIPDANVVWAPGSLNPSVLFHELGHAADTGLQNPGWLSPSSKIVWRNELMANRRASQALRRPELVQEFQNAGVVVPSRSQYFASAKPALDTYRLSLLSQYLPFALPSPPASMLRAAGSQVAARGASVKRVARLARTTEQHNQIIDTLPGWLKRTTPARIPGPIGDSTAWQGIKSTSQAIPGSARTSFPLAE